MARRRRRACGRVARSADEAWVQRRSRGRVHPLGEQCQPRGARGRNRTDRPGRARTAQRGLVSQGYEVAHIHELEELPINNGAIAAEDDTAVLAVGAKAGVVFEPSPWEDVFVASSYADMGRVEEARKLIAGLVERNPDNGRGYFNAACIEARVGDKDRALAYIQRAIELEPEEAREFAKSDTDFDSIRDDPRFT